MNKSKVIIIKYVSIISSIRIIEVMLQYVVTK